jgi:hypothetical protein
MHVYPRVQVLSKATADYACNIYSPASDETLRYSILQQLSTYIVHEGHLIFGKVRLVAAPAVPSRCPRSGHIPRGPASMRGGGREHQSRSIPTSERMLTSNVFRAPTISGAATREPWSHMETQRRQSVRRPSACDPATRRKRGSRRRSAARPRPRPLPHRESRTRAARTTIAPWHEKRAASDPWPTAWSAQAFASRRGPAHS